MEIIISGRHTYVPEAFRKTANEKLKKVELFSPKIDSIKVEVSHENNPKLSEVRLRVEITVYGLGPVIRAESAASEAIAALDLAVDKLSERLRRNHDKVSDHRNYSDSSIKAKDRDAGSSFNPKDLESELKHNAELAKTFSSLEGFGANATSDPSALEARLAVGESVEARLGETPLVIRRKVHAGEKLSIGEALERMELLGHDFYLFIHESTGRCAVMYRRHGWSYGVIELE
ncbi:MAG: ribosome-associated translation inhibitor RaiA [Candidatus Ancillula sp.]|nr:ribosome-associated translation inhibitor RaiA [Candidatus Ancillula sp.]